MDEHDFPPQIVPNVSISIMQYFNNGMMMINFQVYNFKWYIYCYQHV